MATNSSAAVVSSPKTILDLSFNQDGGCFSVATDEGFIVFRADPFVKISRRIFSSSDGGTGGGIGIVQMLYPSNIFALVGGGPTPKFSPNRVMIWDDRLDRCIGELSFRSNVKNLRLTHDSIVVVLLQKILVYNLFDMKLLHETVTEHNPKGLCEVSRTGPLVLLCLGLHKGQVRIEHYARRRCQHIQAHDSDIACFSLMDDGKLVATASSKGTLIRVFNSLDGSLLQELRRGFERAEIYSLSFSSTAPWLAASSDKGTIHVFNLNIDSKSLRINGWQKTEPKKTAASPVSGLSFIKGVLPKYCSSEWSMAQFRVKEGLQHKVAFGQQKNTLNIIGIDGRFYRCQFDPEAGGEMTKLECHNFIQTELS